jgi:hypothetical protein
MKKQLSLCCVLIILPVTAFPQGWEELTAGKLGAELVVEGLKTCVSLLIGKGVDACFSSPGNTDVTALDERLKKVEALVGTDATPLYGVQLNSSTTQSEYIAQVARAMRQIDVTLQNDPVEMRKVNDRVSRLESRMDNVEGRLLKDESLWAIKPLPLNDPYVGHWVPVTSGLIQTRSAHKTQAAGAIDISLNSNRQERASGHFSFSQEIDSDATDTYLAGRILTIAGDVSQKTAEKKDSDTGELYSEINGSYTSGYTKNGNWLDIQGHPVEDFGQVTGFIEDGMLWLNFGEDKIGFRKESLDTQTSKSKNVYNSRSVYAPSVYGQ